MAVPIVDKKGDYVEATKARISYRGWLSRDTNQQVNVSSANWKCIGLCTAEQISLLQASTGLIYRQGANFTVATAFW